MTTAIKDAAYYEAEGLWMLEHYEDEKAAVCLKAAAVLGSKKAADCLQYLGFGLCEDEYQRQTQIQEDGFDYDLQPLKHVSRAGAIVRRAADKVKNAFAFRADSLIWMLESMRAGGGARAQGG